MAKAKIVGTGIYAPGESIDNSELIRLTGLEFDAPKLEEKLGIRSRHIARLRGLGETTADFAERAARAALAEAKVDPQDVGLFVVGTDTPEYVSPATAILVQGRLQGGERDSCAYDVGASCASFTIALDQAARVLATESGLRFAVIIGVYDMPAHIRNDDAFGWSTFADGAVAVVLERVEDSEPSGYVTGLQRTDGTQWDFIGVYAGGTRKPFTRELLDSGDYGLQLLQKLPGDRNVKLWPPLVRATLEKAGRSPENLDHVIFTQINRSVIEEVMGILGLPMEKTTCVMDRYGYTGSGCVPMAFHHAVMEGRVRRGDLVAFAASGAGFAVGSNLFVY